MKKYAYGLRDAIATLVDIRDLARTGTAPDVWNMTELEWAQHKLNLIAHMAHKIVVEFEGNVTDDVEADSGKREGLR